MQSNQENPPIWLSADSGNLSSHFAAMSASEIAQELEQILSAMTEETYDTAIIDAYLDELDRRAPSPAILKVDLYGTAMLLEEVGKVIAPGGVGVTISSQSGWRMPALTAQQDLALATTPTEALLSLDFLQPEAITDTLHAYQPANAAMKSASWPRQRNGANGAHGSMPLPPASL